MTSWELRSWDKEFNSSRDAIVFLPVGTPGENRRDWLCANRTVDIAVKSASITDFDSKVVRNMNFFRKGKRVVSVPSLWQNLLSRFKFLVIVIANRRGSDGFPRNLDRCRHLELLLEHSGCLKVFLCFVLSVLCSTWAKAELSCCKRT